MPAVDQTDARENKSRPSSQDKQGFPRLGSRQDASTALKDGPETSINPDMPRLRMPETQSSLQRIPK